MTVGEFNKWYANSGVERFIHATARKSARDPEDAKDYEQTVWLRVWTMSNGLATGIILDTTFDTINASRSKDIRRRKKEVPATWVTRKR